MNAGDTRGKAKGETSGETREEVNDKAKRGRRPAYHHGALRDALIEAAEAILAESGVERFSLREAARRAGVTAAASAHHFGSAAGLLTEVAIRGYGALTGTLRAARDGGATPAARLRAMGVAYAAFALAYPGLFKLMYRKDLLLDTEALHLAAREALSELSNAVAAYRPDYSPAELNQAVLGAWSVVHGFAHLALDKRLTGRLAGVDAATAVETTLPSILAMLYPDR
jgi:Transcriptional regulator